MVNGRLKPLATGMQVHRRGHHADRAPACAPGTLIEPIELILMGGFPNEGPSWRL
jgi:hypothetical protein